MTRDGNGATGGRRGARDRAYASEDEEACDEVEAKRTAGVEVVVERLSVRRLAASVRVERLVDTMVGFEAAQRVCGSNRVWCGVGDDVWWSRR